MSQTITVEGMSCGHCEQTVEDALALKEVAGVESVTVNRDAERATVEGDAETAALVEAVDEAGYERPVRNCANRLQRYYRRSSTRVPSRGQ